MWKSENCVVLKFFPDENLDMDIFVRVSSICHCANFSSQIFRYTQLQKCFILKNSWFMVVDCTILNVTKGWWKWCFIKFISFYAVCVLDSDNKKVDYGSCTQEEQISGGEVAHPSLPDQGIPAVDGEASMGKAEDAPIVEDIQTTIARKLYQHAVVDQYHTFLFRCHFLVTFLD